MKTGAALLLVSALLNAANAQTTATPSTATAATAAAANVVRVQVPGARVRASDVIPGAADVDLGPTPPVGSSRLIERAEIERAFAAASQPLPKRTPAAVRVSRKTRQLTANEVATAVKSALAEQRLPRGAAVAGVRAIATEVPGDYKKVAVELANIPRRAGSVNVTATVTFLGEGDAPIHKTLLPVELNLPPEAAFPEIARGSAITLTVKKGLVEVSLPGVAAADADIGALVPVTLKPSGRVIRARAIDKDHAVAEES